MIRLTNSLTRRKDAFTPQNAGDVRMYVCGPTVYDRAHMGNARAAVVFDTLYRLLRHSFGPGAVTYVRNITDVDDKINARATESGRSIAEITVETTGWFFDDMTALGCLMPDHNPRATQHIPQMVAMIEGLIAKGHAYAAEGHVLFAVGSFAAYGALSGRTVEDMLAGARVEVAPYKRDPMDFVLWKPSAPDQPGWESPWGRGRPGWHIECSAMAAELLGERFDIHGGGGDLMFPHHENEIAQSTCAHGRPMADVWLHNEMLQVDGRKMSKSLGNFFTVRDKLDQGVPGEVMRMVLLGTHYRKPMDWTDEKVRAAEAALRRWHGLVAGMPEAEVDPEVLKAVSDDLNTAGAITRLHALAAGAEAGEIAPGVLASSAQLLGLLGDGAWAEGVDLSGLENRLSQLRTAAMASKDFGPVDALKTALTEAGVEVRMSKEGVSLSPAAGFDAAKVGQL